MKTIKIRQMDSDDIPAVEKLEQSIFSMPWSSQGFADALAGNQNLFLLAEKENGDIAGYCGLYVLWEDAEITNIAVTGTERRQGLGNKLLGEMVESARIRGVRRIFLEVRPSNRAAICLYQKYGFIPCGIREDYYHQPTEDALCMCLTLK